MAQSSFQGFLQPRPDKKSGAGGIKSIQTNLATINTGSLNVTVNNINPLNSILMQSTVFGGSNPASTCNTCQITNGTTITFQMGVGSLQPLSWQLIEFYSAKSKQSGSTTNSSSTFSIPISAVNVSKAIVFVSRRSTDSTTTGSFQSTCRFTLSSPTTIDVAQTTTSGVNTFEWQVLELN